MSRNNWRSKQNSFTNIDLLSCFPLLLSYTYKTTYQSQEKNSPNFFAKSSSRSKLSLPSSAKTLSFFHVSASYLLVPGIDELIPSSPNKIQFFCNNGIYNFNFKIATEIGLCEVKHKGLRAITNVMKNRTMIQWVVNNMHYICMQCNILVVLCMLNDLHVLIKMWGKRWNFKDCKKRNEI